MILTSGKWIGKVRCLHDNHPAEVVKLVDTLASGASGGNPVEVQVLSSAPYLNAITGTRYRSRTLVSCLFLGLPGQIAVLSTPRQSMQYAKIFTKHTQTEISQNSGSGYNRQGTVIRLSLSLCPAGLCTIVVLFQL